MTLLDDPLLSQRVFFPRTTAVEPSHFVDVDGARVACYWQNPFHDAGTVLHFHGNDELASEYATHYAAIFLSRGLNVCFVEYRGYGLSSGTPALVAMQGDGEMIVQALAIPPSRLVVFGRSLGSLYAIELAHRIPQVAGLILESGIADLLEDWPFPDEINRLGHERETLISEVKTHFDLQQKLKNYHGRLLVMHTEHDRCLDRSHAERLYDWGGGDIKRLVMFPEGDHNTVFSKNAANYLNELATFFQPLGLVSGFRSRYYDEFDHLVDGEQQRQSVIDVIAREQAEEMALYFQRITQQNSGEVWQKGLIMAREWLRLIHSDKISQHELAVFAGIIHANRYRTSAWYDMAKKVYHWLYEKGAPISSPEQFFVQEALSDPREFSKSTPQSLALQYLSLFEEYHHEDPSSEAWASGVNCVQAWLRLIENQEVKRPEVSTLVEIIVENKSKFQSPIWGHTTMGFCYWCKILDYTDLVPEDFRFILKYD